MPLAVEQFDLSSYGLIISSSHAVAKGVLTQPGQLHLSYVYTPMRYAWHLQSQYLNGAGLDKGLKGMLARVTLHYIRLWDARTANGVDAFAAISDFVAKRVRKVYRRDAVVIYPPVNIKEFDVQCDKERFYLAVSRLVPYKRVDLIVEAFSRMPDKRLIVIGDGPDREKVRAKAGSNVTLLGYQSFDAVREHMKRACAFVYAAEEDFGIAAVEAQACGTPVIAYGRGGLAETVVDGETGLLFQEQTTRSLIEAVSAFDQRKPRFDPVLIRRNAERFSRERFRREFSAFVEREYAAFLANGGVASIAHQRIPQTNQYPRVAGPPPDGCSNDLKEFAQADVEGTR
jgi:glycosyltransferase involved in cell wall biosynthesis